MLGNDGPPLTQPSHAQDSWKNQSNKRKKCEVGEESGKNEKPVEDWLNELFGE